MRIIAGRFKGRRLIGPPETGVRPTSDRLRETLFNVIAARVPGARLLDGFAGTGALGLEALSRGADRVTFVEQDRRALRVLEQNLALCGAAGVCTIVRADFLRLPAPAVGEPSFDLVLLDPPYDGTDLAACLAVGAAQLAPTGLLVLEHSRRRANVPEAAAGLHRYRVLMAGDSGLSFFTARSVTHDA